jgi:hypothetical protein
MEKQKTLYVYKGPVYFFDRMIAQSWSGSTLAVSPEKAKANLEYRYKMEHGYSRTARIKLVGNIGIRQKGGNAIGD